MEDAQVNVNVQGTLWKLLELNSTQVGSYTWEVLV